MSGQRILTAAGQPGGRSPVGRGAGGPGDPAKYNFNILHVCIDFFHACRSRVKLF